MRWCRARYLLGSQILVTTVSATSQFETWLEVEVSQHGSATPVIR